MRMRKGALCSPLPSLLFLSFSDFSLWFWGWSSFFGLGDLGFLFLSLISSTSLEWPIPQRTPRISQRLRSLRSIKELEYSLTLRTLYTNAANIVAINCYQFVRLLPARVVSVIITNYLNHLPIMFLPRFYAWLFRIFTCALLLKFFSNVKRILCSFM